MVDPYDPDFDYEENDCWNCGGEGFVSNCFQEFACMYPDEGCDDCTRRCNVCSPRPTPPQPGEPNAPEQGGGE